MAKSKNTRSKKVETKVSKPELEKKPYVLIEETPVGEKIYNKGDEILLTDIGRDYFKSINKIN